MTDAQLLIEALDAIEKSLFVICLLLAGQLVFAGFVFDAWRERNPK